MTTKDWILLFVPIIANGAILFCFQKWISQSIERANKRDALRDQAFMTFWKKAQEFNSFLVARLIREARENPASIHNNLPALGELAVDLTAYYDTNTFDLKCFKDQYDALVKAWDTFMYSCNRFPNTPVVGKSLQAVKDANKELIEAVRKEYGR